MSLSIDKDLDAWREKAVEATVDLTSLGLRAAQTKVAFETAFAQAFLRAKTEGDRVSDAVAKAKATLATAEERLAKEISGNAYDNQKKVVDLLREDAAVLRTKAVSERERIA